MGDTYCYDEEVGKSQKQRELAAADKLFNMLPKDQAAYMRELWDEFEANETAEAKFAKTMDNIQPMMLNSHSGGISWLEHGIAVSQVFKRNERTKEGSETIWEYARDN